MYASDKYLFKNAERRYLEALTFADEKPEEQPLIYARVTKDQVEMM